MGVMPERIGKGPVLRKLDQRYADPNLRKIGKDRLLASPDSEDVADLGAKDDGHGNVVFDDPVKDKAHLKDDWFGRGGKGWWGAQHVDHILKQGLLLALKEATTTGKDRPIKTLWICSGPRGTAPFEVYVYPTDEQVTLIIFSPDLPAGHYTDPDPFKEDDIWVVKRIRDVPSMKGNLDGPKDGDTELRNLGNDIKIVKRKPKTRPDPQP